MKKELSWGAPVPEAIAQQWNRWNYDLPMIESLALPRNIVNGKISEVAEFHCTSAVMLAAMLMVQYHTYDQ